MALHRVLPADEVSADNFTPACPFRPQSAEHLKRTLALKSMLPQQPLKATCVDLNSCCALKGTVAVYHCVSTSGGCFPQRAVPASSGSLSSDTSWSDTRDQNAVDDGLLSPSSGSSAHSASSCPGNSDGVGIENECDDPDTKRARLKYSRSARAPDRCKDADCARVVLRLDKCTFRADEIVGRKLVLF